MLLNLIFAQSINGIIGSNNRLPWKLPEDLIHFRRHSASDPVIMGRKTWHSLPIRLRPLPGRMNLVLTRNPAFQEAGACAVCDLDHALFLAEKTGSKEAWVIGGSHVLEDSLRKAQRLVLTFINRTYSGDVKAPDLGAWRQTSRKDHVLATGIEYSILFLER